MAYAVQHQRRTGTVLLQQLACRRLDQSFAKTWIVTELKSLEWLSIHGDITHAAREHCGGGVHLRTQPALERKDTQKRFFNNGNLQINWLRSHNQPPVNGGRNASSSPACTG